MSLEQSRWLPVRSSKQWALSEFSPELQRWLITNTEIEKTVVPDLPPELPDITDKFVLNVHFYPDSSPGENSSTLYLTSLARTE